ncbi:MAG: LysR family transcriptional regulator [Pigmentiphaga sp.]
MDLRLIDCLMRVVEAGSINRAAEDLGLTQPALSRRIAALEHDLGAALLVRKPRGVELTPAGELLITHAKPLLRQADILRDALGQRVKTHVSIGLPFSLHDMVSVPFTVTELRDASPMSLRVYEGFIHHLHQWMTQNIVDVGVMDYRGIEKSPHHVRPVIREQLLLVGCGLDALALGEEVLPEQLEQMKLILPGRPNVIRQSIDDHLGRQGRRLHDVIDVETLPLCLSFASEGLGHTVMPYSAFHKQSMAGGQLQAIPVRNLYVAWALYVHENRRHVAAVNKIANRLHEFMVNLVEQDRWSRAQVIGPRRGG